MALPFSNVPTAHHVESGPRPGTSTAPGTPWPWCGSSTFRRPASLTKVGRRERRVLMVVGGDLVQRDGVISFPQPAWRWWDDIVFT